VNLLPVQARVIIEETDHLEGRARPVESGNELEGLSGKPPASDQEKWVRCGQIEGRSVASTAGAVLQDRRSEDRWSAEEMRPKETFDMSDGTRAISIEERP
jgi:hypothetical protein